MPDEPRLRDRWFPAADAATPPYAAKHRIADHVRAMIDAVVGLDVALLDPADLASLEEQAAALARRLVQLPDRRRDGSLSMQPPPEGTLVERSPVSGRGNALAPPLEYSFDDDSGVTHAHGVFARAAEGPPGGVHGGCVAAAFDEVLGVAQMVTGVAGFTGTLTVRYRALTPVGKRIDFTAWAEGRDGRKVTMRATATCEGSVVAEAEGLFVAQVALD